MVRGDGIGDNYRDVSRVPVEVGSAANSYEILAKLATGGMAEIFLARGASTAGVERYVVLKRILRHRADDAQFVRMFLDEARLAAQLQHPNIAPVYDIGKLGDSYFFTMEYVHGETVRALLQRSHALRSPIPIASVLVIGAGTAAGLHHAHERNGFDGKPLGIVHRDVSPSNLMVSYEGGVKVVDFGVAKAAHRSHETRAGAVKGKISYLSPEQCRGAPIDRRSDLFSLGIVLWEMLTTERLYKRGTDFEIMQAIVSEPVPAPSSRRPDISLELDNLVLKLLAKDPEQRFQTAGELHEAIENVAVRMGSALSSASLARFLRDLFGQRPEPWIEMQSREAHPEAFTVTSEPIPSDFGIRMADELDLQLGSVPDLSAHQRPPTDGVSTAQVATPIGPEPSGPQPPPVSAFAATLPLPAPRPTPIAPAPIIDAGAPTQSSAQYPALSHAFPSFAPPAPPPEPTRGRAIWVVGVAAAIGIVLGIGLAVRGNETPPAPVGPQVELAVTPTISADAAPVYVVAADAAIVQVAVPPAPIDASVAHADAAERIVTPVATTLDAGIARKPVVHSEEDVVKDFQAGHYSDVVTECASDATLVASNVSACAISACHSHDVVHAHKWIANAGGKRAAIVAACKSTGVNLEPKPKDDCATDPLACQH